MTPASLPCVATLRAAYARRCLVLLIRAALAHVFFV